MLPQLNPGLTCHRNQFRAGYLSPQIWSRVTGRSLAPDGLAHGTWAGDDFCNLGAMSAGTVTYFSGGYAAFGDTGCGVRQKAAATPRAQIYTAGSDNVEAWLQSGGNVGGLGVITATVANRRALYFETCFSVASITNARNVLLGLGTAGLAAADTITDAAAVATAADFLGWYIPEGDPDGVDFVHKAASGAVTTTKADGHVFTAADTLVNLGLVYDPNAPAAKRIRWYINNVEQNTYVTQTQIDAATFPEDIYLAFLAGMKNGSGTGSSIDVKFWQFFQEA